MKKKSKELLHWNCMYQNEVDKKKVVCLGKFKIKDLDLGIDGKS